MPTLTPRFALILALVLSLSSTYAIPFNSLISFPVPTSSLSTPDHGLRPKAGMSVSGPVATTVTLQARQTSALPLPASAPSAPSLSAPSLPVSTPSLPTSAQQAQVTDASASAEGGPVKRQTGSANVEGHAHDNNPPSPPPASVPSISPRSVPVHDQSSRKRATDEVINIPLGDQPVYHYHQDRDHHHHHHNHHSREDPQSFNGRPPMQGWVQPRGDGKGFAVDTPRIHNHKDRAAPDVASGKDFDGRVSSTNGTGVTNHVNTGKRETTPDAVTEANAADKATAESHLHA